MVPRDIPIRARRLFNGDHNVEDLVVIFSYLRFQTFGKAPLVKDIGDFIGHKHERDEGHSFKIASNFAYAMRWLDIKLGDRTLINLNDYSNACKATLNSLDHDYIRKNVKMSETKARKLLRSGLSKISSYSQEGFTYSDNLSKEEVRILEFCDTRFTGPIPFDSEKLISQMEYTLKKNEILTDGYTIKNETKQFIDKFVLTWMHGSTIVDEKRNKICTLSFAVSRDDFLNISIHVPSLRGFDLCGCLYQTQLYFPQSCTDRLLNYHAKPKDVMIELSKNGLIDIIV